MDVLAKIFVILAALIIITLIIFGITCAFMESIGLGVTVLVIVIILTIASLLNA